MPRRVWARFRRLRRAKQALLILLALLDLTLASATALYAWQPAPGAPSSLVGGALAAQATAGASAPSLSIAGIFLADQGRALLVLRQYDGAVTGELTQVTCRHGRAQQTASIVTGQVMTSDLVQLTYSAATLTHSTTVAYHLLPSVTGFVLTWQDANGLFHSQAWSRGTVADLLTRCAPPSTRQAGG